ncbi:SGF29 tudor-like domain-containing protein [Xylariales sp. AK1849]|nr:SGF29 tudor-like domain-containing protein [Xylariales sp. AK1849]
MSSQRNRPRGTNRNNETADYGEELSLWQNVQTDLPSIINAVNESSQNILDIRDHEKSMARKKDSENMTHPDFDKLDALYRGGVKVNDETAQKLKNMIELLKVVKAVKKAKEESEQTSSRPTTQRSKEVAPSSSVYDFDGAGDSPVPSPNPQASKRSNGSKGDRDSVPPKQDRSTPAAKAGSAEPLGPAAAIARSKMTFVKGDEVAFKPKPQNSEQTDWILGIVQEVRGEGKSRRYRVLDADVDEQGHQKDFRTSASSMILIPKDGTNLPPLDGGKVVLALYPATTTFYKAEVIGMDGEGNVNLKFEGEESSNTMQAVKRRHVVEYRG